MSIASDIHRTPGELIATCPLCRSSNAMPKAVRAAVAWSISTGSGEGILAREEADKYVEDMFMSGTRGGEESW